MSNLTDKVFKFKSSINLYCMTDVHIGAVGHDKAKFDRFVNMCLKDRNGYCFMNGDVMEFIPPSYGINEEGQDKSVDEQIDEMVGLVKKLKKKMLFFRNGNHEERGWRLAGIDIAKHIHRETGVTLLHQGIDRIFIDIGKKRYSIVSTHGASSSSKNTLKNMELAVPGADLYFMGHTHELYANTTSMWIDESGQFRNKIQMVGGSFLGWADYARKKNYVPTQTGAYIIRISKDGMSAEVFS